MAKANKAIEAKQAAPVASVSPVVLAKHRNYRDVVCDAVLAELINAGGQRVDVGAIAAALATKAANPGLDALHAAVAKRIAELGAANPTSSLTALASERELRNTVGYNIAKRHGIDASGTYRTRGLRGSDAAGRTIIDTATADVDAARAALAKTVVAKRRGRKS